MLSQFARDALVTVTPSISTASTIPTGVSLPVLPTCHFTSNKVVSTSSASNLNAHDHFGYLIVSPNIVLALKSSIFNTNPSIVYFKLGLKISLNVFK